MWEVFLAALPSEDSQIAEKREVSDAQLVAQAQRGRAEAFGVLHTRYYSRIYRLAYLKTNNASDAEDVASETFARALAYLPRFKFQAAPKGGAPSLYPWLHRIALNLIVDSHRQRPPSGVVSLDAPLIAGMRGMLADALAETQSFGGAPMPTPDEIVQRHEVQQLVRGAIAALPPDQGDVLVYRFLGELSPREIAPVMGRSESAIKSLLHRATVALRSEIERRLEAIERLEATRQTPQAERIQYVGRRDAH